MERMNNEVIRDLLDEVIPERLDGAYPVQFVQTEPGTGLVISRRTPEYAPQVYAVHTFAFLDTAGEPTRRLYDGTYVETYPDALRDFHKRGQRAVRLADDRAARPAQYRPINEVR